MITNYSTKINIIILLSISLFLISCAPKYTTPKINAEYYPQCVKPFQDLADSQKALIQRTIVSGALGAAGGAAIGALASGDWKGALVGGIVGGLAAGTAGYAAEKQRQMKDIKVRLASYRVDMRTDIKNMSQVELYALMSLKCYIKEFRYLINSYKSHKITEIDFKKHYAEIQEGMKQISGILDDAYNESVKKDQEFRDALASERKIAKKEERANRTIEIAERKNSRKTKQIDRANTLAKMERLVDLSHKESTKNVTRQESALSLAVNNSSDVNIDKLSNDFDKGYPNGVVRISSTKAMYAKSLDIMNEAASHAGIDMVYIPNKYYAVLSFNHNN